MVLKKPRHNIIIKSNNSQTCLKSILFCYFVDLILNVWIKFTDDKYYKCLKTKLKHKICYKIVLLFCIWPITKKKNIKTNGLKYF